MTTGLSFETLLNALEACEIQKVSMVHTRIRGALGISIDKDNWARRFQRRDRQAEKVRKALLAKAAAQDARIAELEAQEERDARVVKAARNYVRLDAELSAMALNVSEMTEEEYVERYEKKWRETDDAWWVLVAALEKE